MRTRLFNAWVVALCLTTLPLLVGCQDGQLPTDPAAIGESIQTFVLDFARQILTAFLL
ncbi:MAG: hypothetical protein JXQ73_22535 [Phycisphaerae bacterium]|nr:hypothetical protein [Phycisphaerae bacterium]